MSSPSDPVAGAERPKRSPGWSAAWAATLLAALSWLVPWYPSEHVWLLDFSWCLVLHDSFLRAVPFGTELVFTFGPWGFLFQGFHPGTYPVVLGALACVAVTLHGALFSLARAVVPLPQVAFLWVLSVLALSSLLATDVAFLLLGIVLLLLHFEVRGGSSSPWWTLVLCAMALASLVKFSFFLAGLSAVCAVALEEVLARRRAPRSLLLFALSLGGFWLIARQGLGTLPAFLASSLQMARGYTEAMAMPSKGREGELLLFLCGAAAILAGLGVRGWRRARWLGLLPASGVAGTLLVVFKAAFVRHHDHALIGAGALGATLLLVAPLAAPWLLQKPRRRLAVAALVTVAATGVAAPRVHLETSSERPVLRRLAGPFQPAVWRALVDGTGPLRRDFEGRLSAVRAAYPVGRVEGSVDVYPNVQAVALAHGLEYAPRPVFQSYGAFTPELLRLNAAHLRGGSAPQTILLDVAAIEGRFSSFDDSLSWPELLSRYDLDPREAGGLLRLSRSGRPRTPRLTPLGRAEFALGTPLGIPPRWEGLLWAEVTVRPTVFGRLLLAAFKPPPLLLAVGTRDGKVTPYRLVPEIARAGFLLSPVVRDRADFAALMSGREAELLARQAVTSVGVLGPEGGDAYPAYQRRVQVSVHRLALVRPVDPAVPAP